jgi:hypothetical protein
LLNDGIMRSTFRLASLLFLVTTGLACIEGDYPQSGPAGGTLQAATPEAARFLGAWRQVAGEYGRLCDGATLENGDVSPDRITFREGSVSDEVIVRDAEGCEVTCKVQGTIARGRPGPTCPAGDVTIAVLDYQLDGSALREVTSFVVQSEDRRRCSVLADGVLIRE